MGLFNCSKAISWCGKLNLNSFLMVYIPLFLLKKAAPFGAALVALFIYYHPLVGWVPVLAVVPQVLPGVMPGHWFPPLLDAGWPGRQCCGYHLTLVSRHPLPD
jgi:hypothetical protein